MPSLPETTDVNELGGVLSNYGAVEDPTTDLDADADNKNRACTAMMTHSAIRAMRRFTGHAATPTDPASGFVHDAVWGSTAGVKPTVSIAATVYSVTWPASVSDELGVSHTTNLRMADAWVENTGATHYRASARVTSANVVEVRCFNAAGTALDNVAGLNVCVVAW